MDRLNSKAGPICRKNISLWEEEDFTGYCLGLKGSRIDPPDRFIVDGGSFVIGHNFFIIDGTDLNYSNMQYNSTIYSILCLIQQTKGDLFDSIENSWSLQ